MVDGKTKFKFLRHHIVNNKVLMNINNYNTKNARSFSLYIFKIVSTYINVSNILFDRIKPTYYSLAKPVNRVVVKHAKRNT